VSGEKRAQKHWTSRLYRRLFRNQKPNLEETRDKSRVAGEKRTKKYWTP
jgi:hypothetical protein